MVKKTNNNPALQFKNHVARLGLKQLRQWYFAIPRHPGFVLYITMTPLATSLQVFLVQRGKLSDTHLAMISLEQFRKMEVSHLQEIVKVFKETEKQIDSLQRQIAGLHFDMNRKIDKLVYVK